MDTSNHIPEQVAAQEKIKIPAPKANIYLTIHKAKKLPKKGVFGKADPYTVVTSAGTLPITRKEGR